MPPTPTAYPNSTHQTSPQNLRQVLADLMVEVNRISLELAAYHVARMSDPEVREQFELRARGLCVAPITAAELSADRVSGPVFRVAKGAIGNLTINGMEDRAGKPMPVEKSFPGVSRNVSSAL